MKATLATITVFLAGALAAPAPEPEPWCMRPGQPCWKVKRAAEAFNEAIQSSGGLQARSFEGVASNHAGGAAFKAKRDINELANLIAVALEDEGGAEDYYANLGLDKQFDKDSEEGDETKAKREAGPEPWCMRPGQPCWKKAKREASPEPWCYRPGQPCWKQKREADGQTPEALDKRWCMRPGQPCWKAKRAADAVLERSADPEDVSSKPFAPAYFAKREATPWCLRPGQPCWKEKREASPEPEPWCMRPGQPCWKAKRDLLAMKTYARSIVDSVEA